MKKRFLSALACLLALLLLAGCGRPAAAEPEHGATVPFDEMLYYRPDPQEMDGLMAELNELLEDGASYRKIEGKLDECFDWYYHFYTMYTLAEIHSYLDMTDEFYAEEFEWIDTEFALVQQAYDKLYYACAGSKYAQRLEDEYFWEGFCEQYSDPEDSVYSDEYVALLQQESDLLARYRDLIAAPTVVYKGKKVDVNEILKTLDGQAYNDVLQLYYEKYNPLLAELYIELIGVRSAMAARLDYDSYEQMQYEFYFERDYTPEEADAYLEQIRQYVVPFYKALMAIDAYGQVWYDEVDEDTLYALLENFAGEIGGDVEAAFGFMSEYALYDISVDPKKAPMSFETYIPDYEAPFVFLGASGDTEDVLDFTHEFGHFCDAYVNDGALEESIDLAEVYSQGLELLALTRLGDSMDEEDVANIARIKAIDLAGMYVQQAAFAEFETQVYALAPDELSTEKINEIFLQLCKDYGFYFKGADWYYAACWIDITHFFESPFYVISYPVSNDLAMQIYALEREREGAGVEKYLEVLPRDYNKIMELVEAGGFDSPFGEGRIQEVVQIMKQMYGMK